MTKQKNTMTKENLDRLTEELAALPVKEQTDFNTREVVEKLKVELQYAMDEKRYTIEDFVPMLAKRGTKVSPSTLRAYLQDNEKKKAKAPRNRKTSTNTAKPDMVNIKPDVFKVEDEQTHSAPTVSKKPNGGLPDFDDNADTQGA